MCVTSPSTCTHMRYRPTRRRPGPVPTASIPGPDCPFAPGSIAGSSAVPTPSASPGRPASVPLGIPARRRRRPPRERLRRACASTPPPESPLPPDCDLSRVRPSPVTGGDVARPSRLDHWLGGAGLESPIFGFRATRSASGSGDLAGLTAGALASDDGATSEPRSTRPAVDSCIGLNCPFSCSRSCATNLAHLAQRARPRSRPPAHLARPVHRPGSQDQKR